MTSKTIELIAIGKDEASAELGNVIATSAALGTMAGNIATGGLKMLGDAILNIVNFAGDAAVKIVDLTVESAKMTGVSQTFETLTKDIGGSDYALEQLRLATRGMVSDNDLMAFSNKVIAMGLADTVEEAAQLAEMGSQLGLSMGEDATTGMENFALMLANQSIPRMDFFGISSGEARTRIDELMASDESLTREQAFTTAALELGAKAMEKVGEQGDNSAAALARQEASWENLKKGIGDAFLPVLDTLMPILLDLIEKYGPLIVDVLEEWGGWLGETLPPFLKEFGGLLDVLWTALGNLAEELGINTGEMDSMAIFTGIVSGAMDILKAGVQGLTLIVYGAKQGIHFLKEKFEDIRGVIDRVSTAVQGVRDWINRLKDSFNNIHLPDWLRPGSPSPLENALYGIGKAFASLPNVPISMGLAPNMGGGALAPVYISNYFGPGSVRSDDDILRIADAITTCMERRGVKQPL